MHSEPSKRRNISRKIDFLEFFFLIICWQIAVSIEIMGYDERSLTGANRLSSSRTRQKMKKTFFMRFFRDRGPGYFLEQIRNGLRFS